MAIGKELLEILVCPECKGVLVVTPSEDGLVCERCKLRYPIEDDIPVLLASAAVPID